MKNIAVLLLVLVLSSCSTTLNNNQTRKIASVNDNLNEVCYDMMAGQHIVAGSVCVSNDSENLYVRYSTIDQWLLDEAHLFVGQSLDDMPQTKKGNPKIGKFPYNSEQLNVTYTELTVPLSWLGGPACNTDLFVVAHASISKQNEDGSMQQETSWSKGDVFNERGSWAMYSTYQLSCNENTSGPQVGSCETAFAKGDTTLIDFELTNSRWGWLVTSLLPGEYSYPIYAGAGQNDITKGTHVGNLSVKYDGSSLTVTYNMFSGFVLNETHLYASGNEPTSIAPGLYGNIHELEQVSSDTYSLSGFSGEPLYIIAHAVSCELQQ